MKNEQKLYLDTEKRKTQIFSLRTVHRFWNSIPGKSTYATFPKQHNNNAGVSFYIFAGYMNNRIQIIPSKNIDQAKWDACVRNSPNGIIYALSVYLNHMADNWSGAVLGDYNAVMPIPWRKKWGIRYTYDVPFVQQLGWFAKNGDVGTAEAFLNEMFGFVQYGSYSFNHGNSLQGLQEAGTSLQNNFIINLSATYKSIAENYNTDAINNLKKAARFNLSYQTCSFEGAIDMYIKAYQQRFTGTKEKDYSNFSALCKILGGQDMVCARMVVDENAGIVLSAALFLKDAHRLYNIMNTTISLGRQKSANHFLLDNVFKEFAGSRLVFDFEGSDIAGIKLFYEKFGALNQPYQRIEKFNRLPFPLNLLKR